MAAHEWFGGIRRKVLDLRKTEERIEELRAGSGAKQYGSLGQGGSGDASASMLRVIQAEQDLDRDRARLNAEIGLALGVLYGASGRGGLSKAKGSATADAICGHYLMGMSWRDVADELIRPDSVDGEQWCKRRAYRGLEYIDRRGAGRLISS